MKKSDIDLFELNEAFASVVLRYIQAFDIEQCQDQRQWRRDRARPSALAPPGAMILAPCSTNSSAPTSRPRWSRCASAAAWTRHDHHRRTGLRREADAERSIWSAFCPYAAEATYPEPFAGIVAGREWQSLGDAGAADPVSAST